MTGDAAYLTLLCCTLGIRSMVGHLRHCRLSQLKRFCFRRRVRVGRGVVSQAASTMEMGLRDIIINLYQCKLWTCIGWRIDVFPAVAHEPYLIGTGIAGFWSAKFLSRPRGCYFLCHVQHEATLTLRRRLLGTRRDCGLAKSGARKPSPLQHSPPRPHAPYQELRTWTVLEPCARCRKWSYWPG